MSGRSFSVKWETSQEDILVPNVSLSSSATARVDVPLSQKREATTAMRLWPTLLSMVAKAEGGVLPRSTGRRSTMERKSPLRRRGL